MANQQSFELSEGSLTDDNDQDKFLIFRLGDEYYGTPLVKIREISKMQPIKPVPYMVSYFKGIINLRGQIISIVDLRLKLGIKTAQNEPGLLVIVDTPNGLVGTIVNDVASVHYFEPKDIEKKLAMKTEVPAAYFIGVGHYGDQMVNIIDIAGTLNADDLAALKRSAV